MNCLKLMGLGLIVFIWIGCQEDETGSLDMGSNPRLDEELEATLRMAANGEDLDFFRLPDDGYYSEIPQDPRNPITPEKVQLGRLLYHEPALGIEAMQGESLETYTCASCHFAKAGFQANRVQGIGDGGLGFGPNREPNPNYEEMELDVQDIRSPTAMNGAYQKNMLWNGQFGATGLNTGTEAAWTAGTPKEVNHLGYEGLETQAIAGLEVHRQNIDIEALDAYGYRQLFDQAFPNWPAQDRYTRETAGLAIAAYERTLLSNRAPFQRWLRGFEDAMSDREKEGAILFFGKAECVNCHTGPALNSMEFHALGMKDLFECPEPIFRADAQSVGNKGRGGFTGRAEDMFAFKVPQLYNLKDSPFFGHGSSMRSVREVVAYKNQAIPENPNVPTNLLSDEFHPLQLTASEIDAITTFIENGLYDPLLERYEPNSLPSGFCFPFNDLPARQQVGCN